MCWSGEASAVVATLGFATAGYAAYKKQPMPIWATLGYFALMEALQAYTYTVINQCSLPANQIATLLGYIHIMFQPFFINAVSLYFIPKQVADKIAIPMYTLCFISVIIMMIQLYPFDWSAPCDPRRMLCGPHLCSFSGDWHIAWMIPINEIGNWFPAHGLIPRNGFITYAVVAFWLPFVYGSWRFTTYHAILGPTLALMTTTNVQEAPAIWCLFSFAILLIAVETPLREKMFVKSWPLWRLFGYKPTA
jgi:hypothetical protein